MSRRSPLVRSVLCMWLAVTTGCTSQQPFYLFEDGDLSHYKGMATDLEVPDSASSRWKRSAVPCRRLTLGNPEAAEYWNLSLEEAIKDALANSTVIRSLGVALAAPDTITRGADIAQTVYDPARVETNPRFGTEAALSAFDAQFGQQHVLGKGRPAGERRRYRRSVPGQRQLSRTWGPSRPSCRSTTRRAVRRR